MRRGIAGLALAVAGVFAVGILVPASAASWVDQEWVTAPVGAVDCGEPGMVDATAWGRMLAGKVGTQALDPAAAIDGITVSNVEPATSSTASSAAAVTNLGNDAWTTSLNLAALGAVDLGAGVTLPLGTSAGVYTQYGRATSAGLSVGASGAITSNASGVASLDSPSSATPRNATVQLLDPPRLDGPVGGGNLGRTARRRATAGRDRRCPGVLRLVRAALGPARDPRLGADA